MARSAIHIVQHRRRREQKTDYQLRLSLLRSGMPRVVVRKSNLYVRGQIINYETAGDRVVAQADSAELKAMGWKHSCANVAASYLTGLLLGKRAGVKDAIFDIGLQRSTKGNVLYAFLKGVVDAGVAVPHNPEIMPPADRLNGKHIKAEAEFETVKKKILG
ncbi:MAG: 50S ribosomal protein L18 [Candidatus Aenigmatarchaeota archaeon]|nr:MAG: 50S ribosomal protein L18 [Candidatus Aenigmarchaeota archaeon]